MTLSIKRFRAILFATSLVLALPGLSGCRLWRWAFSADAAPSQGELARSRAEQGKADEAIALYRSHMQQRLDDKRRPEDENPYFYHLMIGDLYLRTGRAEQAKENYLVAKDRSVSKELVADRLRQLAARYAEDKQFESAFSVLQEFRELDPPAFDSDINTVNRKRVEYEDSQKQRQ